MSRVIPAADSMCSARWSVGRFATAAKRHFRVFLAAGLACVAGCATTTPNPNYPRVETSALQDHESTPIGQEIAQLAALHPGRSGGFSLLPGGRQAFTARVALADLAQKTLDLQYFLWEPDATGRILA